MTAIGRVEAAAMTAGLDVRAGKLRRELIITASDTSRMWLGYDRAGRLTGAQVDGPHRSRTMPAADLERRVMSWLDVHRTDTVIPAAVDVMANLDRQHEDDPSEVSYAATVDPFDVVESSTEAADAFTQGGASGLAQLDQRRRGDVYTVSNVAAGSAIGPGARAGVLEPHDFVGRGGPCDLCGRIMRDEVHSFRRPVRGREPYGPEVVQVDGDTFEIRQNGASVSFLGAEAESLRDQLVELLGPAPTDR
jgi:hypothetical protein